MDLYAIQAHMRNRGVMVNGTIYHVDGEGRITDVAEADAAKLLASKYWTAEKAGDAATTRAVRREAYKAQVQLITRSGQVIEKPQQPEAPAASPSNPLASPPAPSAELEFPPMRAEPMAPSAAVAATEPDLTGEGEKTEAGEEWPDPTMTMPKAKLLEMAQAYGVANAAALTKAQLVAAINEAMYG